jgi:uncharacterized membrane protein
MNQPVHAFGEWLSATPLSMQIQAIDWIIPTVQTVRILSIALVTSSAAMVDLHVLGILARSQPLAAIIQRFLPWIWRTLLVSLLSGATLVIGKPGRSLGNPAFILKMCMLAAVLILTLIFQKGITRDERYRESSPPAS